MAGEGGGKMKAIVREIKTQLTKSTTTFRLEIEVEDNTELRKMLVDRYFTGTDIEIDIVKEAGKNEKV